MILSMTGYGKAETVYNGKKIHVEIKSLNSKNFDLSTRITPLYREKEMEIRSLLADAIIRGKVDFSLYTENVSIQSSSPLNGDIIESYAKQIHEISKNKGIDEPENLWEILIKLPEITTKNSTEELSEEEWEQVKMTIQTATNRLNDFRTQEGQALEKKFLEKITNIENLLIHIEDYETLRVEKIRNRIVDGLKKLPEVEYDKNRLEQELIYYIEKLDISEEKQRLKNHLNYFRKTLDKGLGQGKKLGFIAQEMGREINTTGSKSNLAEMQNIVVKMKDELEQIKEQVLNVL